jgi:hypothetical protein
MVVEFDGQIATAFRIDKRWRLPVRVVERDQLSAVGNLILVVKIAHAFKNE